MYLTDWYILIVLSFCCFVILLSYMNLFFVIQHIEAVRCNHFFLENGIALYLYSS